VCILPFVKWISFCNSLAHPFVVQVSCIYCHWKSWETWTIISYIGKHSYKCVEGVFNPCLCVKIIKQCYIVENQEYGLRYPLCWPRKAYIHKSWHWVRRQVVVAWSVYVARGLRPRSLFSLCFLRAATECSSETAPRSRGTYVLQLRLNVPLLMSDWNSFGWSPSKAAWLGTKTYWLTNRRL
jgi:hypothetical protein